MNKHQKGFTLIELVIVIVILGILAVVAIPKFLDLRTEAAQAATDAVAGTISAAFAINYAAALAGNTGSTNISVVPVSANIQTLANGLLGGAGLPAGYTVGSTMNAATVACDAGGTATVGVYNTTSPTVSATATLICTS